MINFGKTPKKVFGLIILDGWGMAPCWGGNAIGLAQTRVFSDIYKQFPSTLLSASGKAVGLPPNSPGNSEAGHLNIGAGQIVHQDGPIIDGLIHDRTFFRNKVLLEAINHAKRNNSTIHLVGLLSKTGIHSRIDHLFALLEMIASHQYNKVSIHLFGDGRDSETMSGIEMADEVTNRCREIGIGRIVSVIGRYYAMDRDNRWDRVAKTYDLLTKAKGRQYISSGSVFADSYSRGNTDEFIEPSIVVNKDRAAEVISNNDAVIFFNFRADRAKEITRTFLDPNLPEMPNRTMLSNLYFATFVMHDEKQMAHQAFFPEEVTNPLARIWSENGLRQFHIAETEKYAHVTYFINGGREKPFPGEDRLMIPSPKSVKTYDEMPEMSAKLVTESLLKAIAKNTYDTFILNFANADMVGHTGDLKATVKAVEFVDRCLGQILEKVLASSGTVLVFADHGNAEQMVNPKTGQPDTEHTTNPVPFIIVSNDEKYQRLQLAKGGKLASIAPTVLKMMGLKYNPAEMEQPLY